MLDLQSSDMRHIR